MTVSFSVSYAVLWALVGFQGLLLLGLIRTIYELKAHGVDASTHDLGLPEGAPAPSFTGQDVFGRSFDSESYADRLTAFLLVSTDCSSCVATLNHFEALQYKAKGTVVVVCSGDQPSCKRIAESYNLSVPVVVDTDMRISKLFGAPATPAAVLIEGGKVRSVGHPVDEDGVTSMVSGAKAADTVPTMSHELAGRVNGARRDG